jgi:hypothetical protein
MCLIFSYDFFNWERLDLPSLPDSISSYSLFFQNGLLFATSKLSDTSVYFLDLFGDLSEWNNFDLGVSPSGIRYFDGKFIFISESYGSYPNKTL